MLNHKLIYNNPPLKKNSIGGGFMGGSVQYHKPANRWYIQIYWEGKRCRLWKDYDTFQPFYTKARALKYLGIAQGQIDKNEFNPRNWEPGSPVFVSNYARDWVRKKNVSKKTQTGYRTAIEKYIVPFFKNADIRRIKAGDLDDFMSWLEKRLETKGVYNIMSVLKTMYRDAYRREDILRVPPFPKLENPTYDKAIEFLTLEQQERLLNAIPNYHRPIFAFGMEYGLRTQEVRGLQRDCIKDGKVYIKKAFAENELKSTKTGRERVYDLTAYAKSILDTVRPHLSPFVFVREDGKPYTNKNLNKIWHEAEKKAEIKCKLQNAFRHSLGCQLLDMGFDLELVRRQLGHTTSDMTRRYARHSTPILTHALEARRSNVIKLKNDMAMD